MPALLILFAISSVLVCILTFFETGIFFAFLKAVPIWALAARVFLNLDDSKGRLLFAGLIASSVGDIILSLPLASSFLLGLAAFFTAHVLYTSSFFMQFHFRPARIIPAGAAVILVSLVGYHIAPHLGAMTGPVFAYVGVIALMTVSAAFRRPSALTVYFGAVIFMSSDSLIAQKNFVAPVPYAGLAIMLTYYAAQLLIAEGSVRDAKRYGSP